MSIEELYKLYLANPIVTTDSRNCPPGSLFFALKGDNFNGNKFASSAIEKGCAYAIVDEKELANNDKIIFVENVLTTLQQLASFHRKKLGTTVIGITGTNGKTTTKELIAAVLNSKYSTLYTQGNLNNHIGVPLTLLSLTNKHEMAVVEMGANHPGEIKTLAEIACPDYGIITNVGKAHLEGFGSFENIISTKGELYDYIRENGGKIFINSDNLYLEKIAFDLPQIKYSFKNRAFVSGKIINASPMVELNWEKENDKHIYNVKTNLIGSYNAENILAAICIGCYFDVEANEICRALENYVPQNNRSQLTKTEKNVLIVDAYNANPTSMEAAILNFEQMNVPKKTLILGDMGELGKSTEAEHQKISELIKRIGFDNVFLIGKHFSATNSSFNKFNNIEEFLQALKENFSINNSYVLIKGSRSAKMERVIEFL
jgi:UDP-N-acetylmuramoyl-tripeptide--D-alanyl-D-alanine ligase